MCPKRKKFFSVHGERLPRCGGGPGEKFSPSRRRALLHVGRGRAASPACRLSWHRLQEKFQESPRKARSSASPYRPKVAAVWEFAPIQPPIQPSRSHTARGPPAPQPSAYMPHASTCRRNCTSPASVRKLTAAPRGKLFSRASATRRQRRAAATMVSCMGEPF